MVPSNNAVCFGAYAYYNNNRSYYNGKHRLQTYIHEFGHNMNLAHAGVEGFPGVIIEETYGDRYVRAFKHVSSILLTIQLFRLTLLLSLRLTIVLTEVARWEQSQLEPR